MLVAALLVATFATVAVVGAAADGECKLNICAQLDTKKEPLLLEITETRDKREQLDFIYPEEVEYKTVDKSKQKIPQGILRVAEGKKLLVACPGEGNVVEGSKKATGTAACTKGKLIINGLEANNKTMSCYKDVARSWVKETNEECGKGNNVGTKFILGFRLTDDGYETFFPMIEICHNTDKMITYYSNHVVHGESMEGRVRFDGRNKFKPDGSFAGVNPETAYSQNRQKEAFDVILGKGAGEKYSVKNKKFLARGHLAPDADFIYNSGQQLTYYYINAAPQWQNFNAYNWLKIENAVRQLSEKVGVTLNVWTGTYGILKLEFKGVEKEIYLEPKELAKPKRSRKSKAQTKDPEDAETTPEDHMPVPEVFWKVVQHPIDRSCTVAVGHNNVFLESEPTPICDPVTVDGWPSQDEFPLDRGSVYYCNYNSFKQTVDYLPEIDCTDLFEFPHKKSS